MSFEVNKIEYSKNGLPINQNGETKQAGRQPEVTAEVEAPVNSTLSPEAKELQANVQKSSEFGFLVAIKKFGSNVLFGVNWLGARVVEAYNFIAGLFEKANETTKKVNEDINNGHRKEAAEKAANFMENELKMKGVNNMDSEAQLKLYNDVILKLKEINGRIGTEGYTPEQALIDIAHETDRLYRSAANDQQRAAVSQKAQETVAKVINNSPAGQLVKSVQELVNTQNAIKRLASSIIDQKLRENVLSQINISNNNLASTVASKLSADQKSNYAEAFISNVQLLRDAFKITCDLTEKIVKLLAENRAEQKRLDDKAAENKAAKVKSEEKEAEEKALKKIAKNGRELSKLQNKLEQLVYSKYSTPEEIKKVNSEINSKSNEPNPIA